MKILVVGGGGREHALCWALKASPLCRKLYCAPGNAGIAQEAECVAIEAEDIEGILRFCKTQKIDFVIVGPEVSLVMGLINRLSESGIKAFGPSAAAARLEGSKGFMKDLFASQGIPTAAYGRFTEARAAKDFVDQKGAPIVVKADGLAAGKGVIICNTIREAHDAIDHIMIEKAFGNAGSEVVVEEFLNGEEVSFFALVDGLNTLPLASAQDHKAVGEGDTGPNTGGMGAYSPAQIVDAAMEDRIMTEIITPTVTAMAKASAPFVGVLFAGLMITDSGPKVLEFNVRFGDPECQVLMMRLKSDLLPALLAAVDGQLSSFDLQWHPDTAMVVVMASNGYPGKYEKGTEIRGSETADTMTGVKVFHAGTKKNGEKLLANGGRVLGVTASAATTTEAQKLAYAAIKKISWPGGFCRHDIGWRAIQRENM